MEPTHSAFHRHRSCPYSPSEYLGASAEIDPVRYRNRSTSTMSLSIHAQETRTALQCCPSGFTLKALVPPIASIHIHHVQAVQGSRQNYSTTYRNCDINETSDSSKPPGLEAANSPIVTLFHYTLLSLRTPRGWDTNPRAKTGVKGGEKFMHSDVATTKSPRYHARAGQSRAVCIAS